MYLWRTLRLHDGNGIFAPRALQIGLVPLLEATEVKERPNPLVGIDTSRPSHGRTLGRPLRFCQNPRHSVAVSTGQAPATMPLLVWVQKIENILGPHQLARRMHLIDESRTPPSA